MKLFSIKNLALICIGIGIGIGISIGIGIGTGTSDAEYEQGYKDGCADAATSAMCNCLFDRQIVGYDFLEECPPKTAPMLVSGVTKGYDLGYYEGFGDVIFSYDCSWMPE